MSNQKTTTPSNTNTNNLNLSPTCGFRRERRYTLIELPNPHNTPPSPGFNNNTRVTRNLSPPPPRRFQSDKVFKGAGENGNTLGVSLTMRGVEEKRDEGEGELKEKGEEKGKAKGKDLLGRPLKPCKGNRGRSRGNY